MDVETMTGGGGIFPSLKLVPPTSEDFSVYGDAGDVARARSWALEYHYLLAQGVATCGHGMVGLPYCPGDCLSMRAFDHVQMWVKDIDGGGAQAFLLAQPYDLEGADEVELSGYAAAWGLDLQVTREPAHEQWYYSTSGTGVSVRLTLPHDYPLWPIERDATLLLVTQPVRWQLPVSVQLDRLSMDAESREKLRDLDKDSPDER